jgi:hypothetical protein
MGSAASRCFCLGCGMGCAPRTAGILASCIEHVSRRVMRRAFSSRRDHMHFALVRFGSVRIEPDAGPAAVVRPAPRSKLSAHMYADVRSRRAEKGTVKAGASRSGFLSFQARGATCQTTRRKFSCPASSTSSAQSSPSLRSFRSSGCARTLCAATHRLANAIGPGFSTSPEKP